MRSYKTASLIPRGRMCGHPRAGQQRGHLGWVTVVLRRLERIKAWKQTANELCLIGLSEPVQGRG